MTFKEREYAVSRLIAGCIKCSIKNNNGCVIHLLVKTPSRYHRYIAQEIYVDKLRESELEGSCTEEEILNILISKKMWDDDKETKLAKLIKDVDEIKMELYHLVFKSVERAMKKKELDLIRAEINKLSEIKNSFSHSSAIGAAEMAKARYLIAHSLFYLDGQPVYHTEYDYWHSDDTVIENVVHCINSKRLSEGDLREIARTEPWRSIWNCRKPEGELFGVPAVDLSDEQRILCVWSGIYDSIYEHPEAPGEEVIEDDDILDGWMLVQKKKREQSMLDAATGAITDNEKIKSAGEIFIPANNMRDAKKIGALNDRGAQITKAQRMSLLRKKGIVQEIEMPDSKQKIEAELANMWAEHQRGSK
jgi:hypothetical protein